MNERQPHFAIPDRQAALLEELEGWRGTRFRAGSGSAARKGVACDCVSFVERVLVNLGAIKPIQWPPYVPNAGGIVMFDLLTDTMSSIPGLEIVWRWHNQHKPELMPGDVLLISSIRALHHLALYAGGKTVWHATMALRGVGQGNVDDPLVRKHLKAVYRAYEL